MVRVCSGHARGHVSVGGLELVARRGRFDDDVSVRRHVGVARLVLVRLGRLGWFVVIVGATGIARIAVDALAAIVVVHVVLASGWRMVAPVDGRRYYSRFSTHSNQHLGT